MKEGSAPVLHGPFSILNVRVDSAVANKGFTLYEAIDDLVWNDIEDTEIFLENVGDVLVMEVENSMNNIQGLGISIPAVWYADRYLESAIHEAKEMRDRKEAIMTQANNVEVVKNQIMSYNRPGQFANMNAEHLVTTMMTYFQQTADYKQSLEQGDPQHSAGMPLQSIVTLQEQLTALMEQVLHKVNGICLSHDVNLSC